MNFARPRATTENTQECADKVGLGFVLPTNKQQPMIDKSGQVLGVEEQEAVAV